MTTNIAAHSVIEGTPVLFTTDPSQTGSVVGRPVPFTSLNGTIIDPDTVTFAYQVQGQTVVSYTWTNPSGDPSNMIVHSGTGLFYIIVPTAGLAGTWVYQWSCAPVISGPDSTNTEVVWDGEIYISPAAIL